MEPFGHVVAPGYDPATAYYHRPDGDLVLLKGQLSFLEGFRHVFLVDVHNE